MAWRKPTEDDIVATLSHEELEAYKADGGWSSDPVDLLCRRAAALVRDYLRTNGNVRMSPNEGEIPEGCISPAMDYLAFDVLKRFGVSISQERKDARAAALAYFEKIAAGKLKPESYGASETATTGGPAVEIVTSSRHRMDAHSLEGL